MVYCTWESEIEIKKWTESHSIQYVIIWSWPIHYQSPIHLYFLSPSTKHTRFRTIPAYRTRHLCLRTKVNDIYLYRAKLSLRWVQGHSKLFLIKKHSFSTRINIHKKTIKKSHHNATSYLCQYPTDEHFSFDIYLESMLRAGASLEALE